MYCSEYLAVDMITQSRTTLANIRRWASWLRWINPISYGFESVMVNEFNGRRFECSSFVPSGPSYENIAAEQRACAVQGSQPGMDFVGGTAYVETAFRYYYGNRWRNYGVIVVITFALFVAHLVMSELVASERSKGEVLVFRRSKMNTKDKRTIADEETGTASAHGGEKVDNSDRSEHNVQKQVSIFHWEKVNYEIQIKGETRTILDSVDGWIKPGTLTALMVSIRKRWICQVLTSKRAYQARARPRCSMFSLVEQLWASSLVTCW
jgi:ATP-binding cassette subfamily G (WHITE) protein 2 (PDR)